MQGSGNHWFRLLPDVLLINTFAMIPSNANNTWDPFTAFSKTCKDAKKLADEILKTNIPLDFTIRSGSQYKLFLHMVKSKYHLKKISIKFSYLANQKLIFDAIRVTALTSIFIQDPERINWRSAKPILTAEQWLKLARGNYKILFVAPLSEPSSHKEKEICTQFFNIFNNNPEFQQARHNYQIERKRRDQEMIRKAITQDNARYAWSTISYFTDMF